MVNLARRSPTAVNARVLMVRESVTKKPYEERVLFAVWQIPSVAAV